MDKDSKVPPITDKSLKRESLDRYSRADTGGDAYNRSRSQYAKDQPERADPFAD